VRDCAGCASVGVGWPCTAGIKNDGIRRLGPLKVGHPPTRPLSTTSTTQRHLTHSVCFTSFGCRAKAATRKRPSGVGCSCARTDSGRGLLVTVSLARRCGWAPAGSPHATMSLTRAVGTQSVGSENVCCVICSEVATTSPLLSLCAHTRMHTTRVRGQREQTVLQLH
jgi:hypothetical protein